MQMVLVNVLTEADLFVHPSNIENSPNSVCEAQLLGIPIVATNAGGVSSLVKDEDDGLLVAPRDVYAMASKIARLLNNPQETDMLSKKGRLHALERHNPNMIVENLFKIYKELLSE
jgi:glycosyltransferase involved in cell wall biosynthesis